MNIAQLIAKELAVQAQQVQVAVDLLDAGSTVPFIARYRKEATRGLDDTELRQLQTRLKYLRELEERRQTVLQSIAAVGKLDDTLRHRILAADTKTTLEDLYLPFKRKRRSKAEIAREAGLGPLADMLLEDSNQIPESQARRFLNPARQVPDATAALEGAGHILAEKFAEDAGLLGELREHLWSRGLLVTKAVKGKEEQGSKFRDYFRYAEPIAKIPSHRALALFRGHNEGVLSIDLELEAGSPERLHPCEAVIARHFGIRDRGRAAHKWLMENVHRAWKAKLYPRLKLDLMKRLRERAERAAIEVFARNLRDLLLMAPAGARATIGLDPGLRTGVKVAAIDATGKLEETAVIYPHAPRNDWDRAIRDLAAMAARRATSLIAIGNGTASRETDRLVAELIERHPQLGLQKVVVSEAGASVYSASELAAKEMPGVDVTMRGAVSIGRRLQDPLAELVKIDPKSIGVGQYQHDINQGELGRTLSAVVEDCVNAVGVDVNTASAALLTHVSGLSQTLAENVVEYREQNGAFPDRRRFKKVPRLGDKAFEQCAGFLRIRGGRNALDASAVHPEAYPLVERIAADTGLRIHQLIGDGEALARLDPRRYTDTRFGLPTVEDIIAELDKPGRDPRPQFKTAEFRAGVERLADLKSEMTLEGVVTNVTHFGAFVDVGVHQDGLVHISEMAERFVKDPHEMVSAGDVVKVRVLEVDLSRKRIALSMKASSGKPPAHKRETPPVGTAGSPGIQATHTHRQPLGSLGDALARARKGKS